MKKKLLWLLPIAAMLLIACGASGGETDESGTAASDSGEAKETTIYLVRHGKTWFNTQNQVQGYSDSLLTEEGEKQAKLVGEGLKDIEFTAAYSSDLGRQRNTAKLILEQNKNDVPQITENIGFREKNFGSFEGLSNDDMNIAVAKALKLANKVAEVDPTQTAETYDEMHQRVSKVMPEVMKEVDAQGGGNVLIVSSGGIIPIILESIAPGEYQGEKIANCSVTTLTYKEGKYTIESIGDTSYVDQN